MIKRIASALKYYRTFLITSHTGPDGDSIGSQIALALLLKRLKKKVTIINDDPIPELYQFLPHSNLISKIKNSKLKIKNFETVVVLDCSNLERAGKVGSLISKLKIKIPPLTNQTIFSRNLESPNLHLTHSQHSKLKIIINIDHHLDNALFGSLNWVDKKASSVAEQIFSLSKCLNIPLDKKLATLLYTGITTDTGSFQYHLTPATHKIIATLISKGAIPEEIAKNVYQSLPFTSFKLFGLGLSTLRETPDHKVCWMKITKEMYRKTKTSPENTEAFINYLQQIKNIKILFILKEAPRNKTKVSFRSIGRIDVQKLAKRFGGGGHRNASGATLVKPIEKAEKIILNTIKETIF